MSVKEYEISGPVFGKPLLLRSIMLLMTIAILFPDMTRAEQAIEGCYPLTLQDASGFDVPRFEDFRVKAIFKGKPAPADVKTQARARLYRTKLREGAAEGSNFAGRFTVVNWGHGTGLREFAIVDAKSGRVFFPPEISVVDFNDVDFSPGEQNAEFQAMFYRVDSRLLVALGSLGPDQSSEGISYFEWTGTSFRKVDFIVIHKKSCGDASSC